jgi:hypothetical protein
LGQKILVSVKVRAKFAKPRFDNTKESHDEKNNSF